MSAKLKDIDVETMRAEVETLYSSAKALLKKLKEAQEPFEEPRYSVGCALLKLDEARETAWHLKMNR